MWQSLEAAFPQDIEDRERTLITRLHYCKENLLSIPEFLKKFKGICDELAAIQKSVSDEDKVSWLATGLGPKHMNFIGPQLSKPPMPTFS